MPEMNKVLLLSQEFSYFWESILQKHDQFNFYTYDIQPAAFPV